jgi:hypothetical protein
MYRFLTRGHWLFLGGVVAVALIFTLSAASPQPIPGLKAAPAEQLASAGITFRAPSAPAVISSDVATRAALVQVPGGTVDQIILADFTDTHRSPAVSGLVWAVSFRPSAAVVRPGGPAVGHSDAMAPLVYIVILIDANTGEFVEGLSGS